jgi:hypothetical protein
MILGRNEDSLYKPQKSSSLRAVEQLSFHPPANSKIS